MRAERSTDGAHPARDGARLALGTLSIVPVPPPRVVDRRSAGWAMTLAPLVGLLLAVVATAVVGLLGLLGSAPPLLVSALVIGALAVLTRGLHLDGLADTADGLGSGRPAPEALAVMRHGDVGPFGVATLVLVLLVQVAALAALLPAGHGASGVALALVVSRFVLPLACSRGVPAARSDGLGQAVAGTVTRGQLLLAAGLTVATMGGFALAADTDPAQQVLAAVLAVAAGALLCRRCVGRFGGVSGDVLGACVEVTFTVALVVPAALA